MKAKDFEDSNPGEDAHFLPKSTPRPPLPYFPVVICLALTSFLLVVFFLAVLGPRIDPVSFPPPQFSYYPESDIVGLVFTSYFFVLFFICFLFTACTDPGQVPRVFPWDPTKPDPSSSFAGAGPHALRGVERKLDGRTRFCTKCNCYKPDRAHHCKKLGRCVLEMDHWCPWVRNTIGFFNRKYFFLTLTYGLSALISFWIVIFPYLLSLNFANALDGVLLFAFIIASLQLVLLAAFWSFHVYLTVHSFTTIEYREKHHARSSKVTLRSGERVRDLYQQSPFDLGVYHSFTHLLGKNVLLWFIPTRYGMDHQGIIFETREDHPLSAPGVGILTHS